MNAPTTPPESASSAWAIGRFADIVDAGGDRLIGQLCTASANAGRDATSDQIEAWRAEYDCVESAWDRVTRACPDAGSWGLAFEFSIPRRGRRIDLVVLAGRTVFAVEFKAGASSFDRASVWQAEDYALDLRDFHLTSRGLLVVPILVATVFGGPTHSRAGDELDVRCTGSVGLAEALSERASGERQIEAIDWARGAYSPTPSIVEATQKVYAAQTVSELSRASADNLTGTVRRVSELVASARADGQRLICLVTGVPGSGKTLAGLAAAAAIGAEGAERATFMSGNGPLVTVLREAISRDARSRTGSMKKARRHAATLIQNVHEFTRHYGVQRPDLPPDEHAVIFDEAQRAWHAEKLGKRYEGLDASEPELMLQIMSRAKGWSAIIALVGNGQEIHDGEAGLAEWGRALRRHHPEWRVVASPDALRGAPAFVGDSLLPEGDEASISVRAEPLCHLAVSLRSPRTQCISDWVDAVLDCDTDRAAEAIRDLRGFRLALTRDLGEARRWLLDASRGEMRPGLIASSRALRLRPNGLEVSPAFLDSVSVERWFLDGPDDFRSSHSLEIALTEFKVQGLELDYTGVCWSNDLVLNAAHDGWEARRLHGALWRRIGHGIGHVYAINKYRVLLTRAREGMVIYVPRGNADDPTRDPDQLDGVAEFLTECGVKPILPATA